MTELLLLILGFVAASGFFALIDAAILNVTPAEAEVLVAEKRRGARELKRLLRSMTRAIIVIVIFTNVTNVLGPILAGRKAVELFGSDSIGVITAVLTFLTIIFSEIIPKSLGAHYAPLISRIVAPFLLAAIVVLFPLVVLLERFVRLFKSGKRKVGTEEQIRALANIGGGAGHIDADERELIHRAFVLNDRRAKDIMTPVASMVTVDAATTVRKAVRVIFTHHYSRYPLRDASGGVRGYVLSRDVLEAFADGDEHRAVSSLARSLPSVEGSLPCDELLNVLRKTAAQLVLVTEEGKTVGLVTLEDVLEELVGEIEDEGDREN